MRAVQEAAGARLLHHLGTGVAAHATEAVIAEDDSAVLHPGVGNDKFAIYVKTKARNNIRKTTSGPQTSLHVYAHTSWDNNNDECRTCV